MADEISATIRFEVNNGGLSFKRAKGTRRKDQSTAAGGGPGTVLIGTTEETISFGDITPGSLYIENLDATNYVDVGFATGVYPIRLAPYGSGLPNFLTLNSATVYMKADTASCYVDICAASD